MRSRQYSCLYRVLLLAVAAGIIAISSQSTGLAWAKEVEVTKEWKLLGENDTIPAGMHVRMDMTTGEKWVKLLDEDEEEDDDDDDGSKVQSAILQGDGSVQLATTTTTTTTTTASDDSVDEIPEAPEYDYEMMHRTLSNLPEEEKERMGGIPELPQDTGSARSKVLTSKERQAFEKRMAEIWERRQEELKDVQDLLMDLPEVLKQRIQGIKEYLQDPAEHLQEMDLDEELPEGAVTHIVSLLEDLEFQLNDLDNTRDFHTLGGWELLVSLLSEDVHTQNTTIAQKSKRTEGKIRAVQAHAAWAIGSAVKNTGEFFPYAVEKVKIGGGQRSSGSSSTTALEMLIEVFGTEHQDAKRWEIRRLLEKCIYAIGALLRGNRMAQAYLVQTDGATGLVKKLRSLALGSYSSSDVKLIQRLLSLASDIVNDIRLHGDPSQASLNSAIVGAFTSADWCDATSIVLTSESSLPVRVQETLLETMETLASHCEGTWKERSKEHLGALERMTIDWSRNKEDFDPEHFEQLNVLVRQTRDALATSVPDL